MTLRFGVAEGLSSTSHTGVVVADQQRWGWAWAATESGWKPQRLDPGARCHGVGILYPRLFSALYAAGGSIWVQAGSRLWDAAQIRTVVQLHERLRTAAYELTFHDGRSVSVQLDMPAAVIAHQLIDPTYDEIDSWADDIMKTLPYVAADGSGSSDEDVSSWVLRVSPLWEEGFRHSS